MNPQRQKIFDRRLKEKDNCCQVVLGAFSKDFSCEQDALFAMAGGFGGGMGLGEKCGAVCAMFMVAGLYFGYFPGTDLKKKEELKSVVRRLNHRFTECFGSTCCSELMENIANGKYDLADVQSQGKRPCAIFMQKACEILEEEFAK